MSLLRTILRRIEDVLAAIAAASLVAIIFLMLADVVFRYLISSPFPWAFDVLTRYLLPAAIFFSFSYTLRYNEHLFVEVVYHRIPQRPRDLLLGFAMISAIAIIGLAFWTSILTLRRSWVGNELLVGAIQWPIWTSKVIMTIGLGILFLRCIERTVTLIAAAAENRPADLASGGSRQNS